MAQSARRAIPEGGKFPDIVTATVYNPPPAMRARELGGGRNGNEGGQEGETINENTTTDLDDEKASETKGSFDCLPTGVEKGRHARELH